MSDDRGYSISGLDELGEGPRFRKIRKLGVDAFGVNAIGLPAGYTTHVHLRRLSQHSTTFTARPPSEVSL